MISKLPLESMPDDYAITELNDERRALLLQGLTSATRTAVRTTYLSSIMQHQRNGALDLSDESRTPASAAREFILWTGANRNPSGLIDMWFVPEISAEQLNAVMDEVDAEG